MTQEKIKELISQMTLEEKAGLCSGADFWHTKAVERLGIPAIMVSDGPHGLRKQDEAGDHLGVNDSIEAVCFPAGCATTASFDRELVKRLGETLGEECQAEDVAVILGPAINIKRSPLCGRNFEYYSEDPYLAGEIAAGLVDGVQSKGVGTSVKHFLANNQEHRRMTSSSEIDERTLREIYLPAFETVVKKSQPWTIMCSYNKINGEYASENERYLTQILRDEWGFQGFVVSDWGAVNDRVKGVKAGLELEMPSSNGINDKKIVEAVKNNELDETVLNQAVERILNIVFAYSENRNDTAVFDRAADHKIAEQLEEECAVLLKNDGILPLSGEKKVAFIGKYAKYPRYQGGGSSHINSSKVTSALEAVENIAKVTYAQGYVDEEDRVDETLLKEAVEAAKQAEVAVIFAGLPDAFESEGYDRVHMQLPNCQNRLIEEILKVQKNCVIVLHNGSPVEMPWKEKIRAILEMYLGGEGVGVAAGRILFGEVNPSGRLPETFPMKLSDNPSYLYYVGEGDRVEYREGVFVGYRYYDKKEIPVLFPFGHGLSYTEFAYDNLRLNRSKMTENDTLEVSVDITNIGKRAGKEVVQLYVGKHNSAVIRPVKELREFTKLSLEPQEKKTVTFTLDARAFSYYNTDMKDWYAESGEYQIMIGKSAADIVATTEVTLENSKKPAKYFHENVTIGDVMEDEKARAVIEEIVAKMGIFQPQKEESDAAKEAISAQMQMAMMKDMPLRAIKSFAAGAVSEEEFNQLLEKLNQR